MIAMKKVPLEKHTQAQDAFVKFKLKNVGKIESRKVTDGEDKYSPPSC